MKVKPFARYLAAGLLLAAAIISRPSPARAATTIDPADRYAWAANLGWMDWRGDVAGGAVIGEYVCSGCIYAANAGWISLGSGSPANGVQYQNNSAGDYGVNRDIQGNLRGYAYGANIGWINFEANGAPRVDLETGNFTGYAWSANCGWLSLSNAAAHVRTDTIAPGADSDADGIADAWERLYFGNLSAANGASDSDHDWMTDQQEYLAGTSPLNPNSNLRITRVERGLPPHDPAYVILAWTSEPTRFYRLERRLAFDPASPWETYLSYDSLGWTSVGFNSSDPRCFYRIRVQRPLMP